MSRRRTMSCCLQAPPLPSICLVKAPGTFGGEGPKRPEDKVRPELKGPRAPVETIGSGTKLHGLLCGVFHEGEVARVRPAPRRERVVAANVRKRHGRRRKALLHDPRKDLIDGVHTLPGV